MNDLLIFDRVTEWLRIHQMTVDGVTFRMTFAYADCFEWEEYTIRVWQLMDDGSWDEIDELEIKNHDDHMTDSWNTQSRRNLAWLYWTWLLKDPFNWRVSAEMEGVLT